MKNVFVFITIILVGVSAIMLGACGRSGAGNSDNASGHANHTEAAKTIGDSDKAFRIDFKSEPGEISAGAPANLFFTVKDRQGATVKDLQIVHEKPMHLLVVSKDLAEFYHVHPEQQAEDGSYRVQHTFPNGGEYTIYTDFTPRAAVQVVEQINVKVAGNERPTMALVADTKFEKTIDGLKVVMRPSSELKAGEELTLDFQAFDAVSGKPATDLQNYLGELAHFVIISEDMKDFVHAHPMARGESMDSMKMDDKRSDSHDHSKMDGAGAKPSASEVSAHTTFPRAELYKLWAQFQRNNKVISVPFVVSVPAGKTVAVKPANVLAGATRITVSGDGFEPSQISVKKGEPVKLAFYRQDADNCGGEVVFSKMNIKKRLRVGETVLVEFTPEEAGEISFACGMNMMKGKVLVQ